MLHRIGDILYSIMISSDTKIYNAKLAQTDKEICDALAHEIDQHLPEATNKVWHAHPVWFLDGNPIVGYSKQKDGVKLMFWSGADFDEDLLESGTGKFKDASVKYTEVAQIQTEDLVRWLGKSRDIQWDYKNIVKRKGKLLKIEK